MATKQVYYDDGPDHTVFADVLFQRGVAQPVDAQIADELIRKGRVKEAQQGSGGEKERREKKEQEPSRAFAVEASGRSAEGGDSVKSNDNGPLLNPKSAIRNPKLQPKEE